MAYILNEIDQHRPVDVRMKKFSIPTMAFQTYVGPLKMEIWIMPNMTLFAVVNLGPVAI